MVWVGLPHRYDDPMATTKASGRRGRFGYGALFVLPALFVLAAMVLYPALKTVYDSFFDRFGREYVGLDNYSTMFGAGRMRKAILNSFLWTAILPVMVTTVGLVLAVLAEKLKWKTAFRLVLFLPVAVAVMSSGIIWRIVFDVSPDRGLLNALANVPISSLKPDGDYPGAVASSDTLIVRADGSIAAAVVVDTGGAVANLGLLRIEIVDLPTDAIEAPTLSPGAGSITGVVWRDTKPGSNEKGVVESAELGLPGVLLELISNDGSTLARTTTGDDGSYTIAGVAPGSYEVRIASSVFREPWKGIEWLGTDLITPSAMIAGLWIWAGFSLVLIGAGLASLDRKVLEAARVDGASEWQVFRRITLPLLAPVIGVVFVTLAINALKMFDLVVGIAPGSVQADANVIALEMWRTAFTGLGNRGLAAAISVFLFVLILPIMAFNLHRFRLEEARR
jgi:alpha-glucoside transport system permease protein